MKEYSQTLSYIIQLQSIVELPSSLDKGIDLSVFKIKVMADFLESRLSIKSIGTLEFFFLF